MAVGSIVAAIAVYEFFFSASWNDFIVNRVKYTTYQLQILDVKPMNFFDIRFYGHLGDAKFVRVGSVLLSPLVLGFYLLMPFAAAVERTLRAGLRGAAGACLVLTSAALLLTQTRAALLGAVIIGVVALRPAAGREANQRVRLGLLLLAAALIALPAATATGFTERVATTASGNEPGAVDHVQSFFDGTRAIADHPLGQGLGTSAGTGQRFQVSQRVITENYYLQVGVEMGVAAMALFIALTLLMLRRLRNAVGQSPDPGVAAVRGAALSLAIGALFLHTFNDFAVAWTMWSLAGAVIGIAAARAEHHEPRDYPAREVARTSSAPLR
jgi:O-antigen ligase